MPVSNESRCRIYSQDIGELRVKLAIHKTSGITPELEKQLTALLEKLPEETRRLIHFEANVGTADWTIQLLSPKTAASEYGLTVSSPVLILTPRGQRTEPSPPSSATSPTANQHRLIAVHPFPQEMSLESQNRLLHQLSEQLQKIFTWQNVWRISDVTQADATDSDLQLRLTVKRSGEEIENPAELFSGEKVEVQLSNTGTRDWWVTLMFLGSDLSISQWTSGSIKASSDFRKLRATVDPHTSGAEGFVVFASPISTTQQEPRFVFLEQSGLNDSETKRSVTANPNSPFGQLFDGARTGKATRSLTMDTPDQPSVLLKSWITHPVGGKR